MKNLVAGDIITTSSTSNLRKGDTIVFCSSDGTTKDFAKVTAKKGGGFLSIRPLRWYERWWLRVKTVVKGVKRRFSA